MSKSGTVPPFPQQRREFIDWLPQYEEVTISSDNSQTLADYIMLQNHMNNLYSFDASKTPIKEIELPSKKADVLGLCVASMLNTGRTNYSDLSQQNNKKTVSAFDVNHCLLL